MTQYTPEQQKAMEETRNFLCGYQLCLDMLNLRRYERKRAPAFDDLCDCSDILSGDEGYWRARMYEVGTLIGNMRNGKEKLILYYHYVRGESIEHAADLLGVSRRTGYRIHNKALFQASFLLRRAGLLAEEEPPFPVSDASLRNIAGKA